MSSSNKTLDEAMELENRGPVASSSGTALPSSESSVTLATVTTHSFTSSAAPDLIRNESALAPVDGGIGAWSFVQPNLAFFAESK